MKLSDLPMVANGNHLNAIKANVVGENASADGELREVARQFESLFTHMLLKNMRSASLGEGAMDSEQSRFFRDMFDQQLAGELANGGGLGVADMLVRHLDGNSVTAPRRTVRSDAPMASPSKEISAAVDSTGTEADPIGFVRRLLPYAQNAAKLLGVEPQFLLAQAALETGWGKFSPQSDSGRKSHNLFGIKANSNWHGDRARTTTREFHAGLEKTVEAEFRSYNSEAESFADYASLIMNSNRYSEALNRGKDGAAYFSALQKGGYATDPQYASKIMRIASSSTMKTALAGLKIP